MNRKAKNSKTQIPSPNSPFPKGWVWVRLGEICAVNLGKTPNKSQYVNKGRYKIVKFRDVTNNGINYDEDERGFVIDNGKVISELIELKERDILVTASAHSSEHIGKKVVYVSKIPKRYEKVFFVGELLCVRNRDNNIEPRTIYYYLMSQDGYKSIQNHVRGVHLIASEARQIPIPLPPLPEQRRIVAKIEELFTRLDAGVEALKRAKEQIKRYRQAVLKYAFEGKLTEEWRVKANHFVGAIHELPLQNGKKYKELPPVNTSELPELPKGWVWVRLGEVSERLFAGGDVPKINFSKTKTSDFKIPIYTNGEKDKGLYGYTNMVKVNEPALTISGRGTIGYCEIRNEPFYPAVRLIVVIPDEKIVGLKYLKYTFDNRRLFFSGSSIPQLTVPMISEIPIPLPPLAEQQKIVEEIERRFSVVDEVEKAIDKSLKEAERLRQSILKKAFEGKLVPQDPNDEPAEKLLERIKNRRAESCKANS